MEGNAVKIVSFPELSTEQKLRVREARFKISRAQDFVREATAAFMKEVEAVAKEVGADPESMLFNEDMLQFVPKQ